MKHRILKTTVFFTGLASATAQNLDVTGQAESFWEDISEAAPYILATIFLISCLANIGKVSGENRDYMAFFRGVGLWAGSITLIGAIVAFILSRNFA